MRPVKQGKSREMATSSTSWTKGQSGNPNGRKAKGRTLADQLRKETSKSVEYQGKRVSGKQALAFMALDGLINGEVKFANGVKILLSEEGWLSLFKFIHTHLDGPVKPDPEPLDVVTWSPDEWRKEAARRHGEASDTMATFDDLDAQDGE